MVNRKTYRCSCKRVAVFYLLLICIGSITAGSRIVYCAWERASPCSDSNWGWAGLDPIKNIYNITIENWDKEFRYIFKGEIAWDPNQGSTRGDVVLLVPGKEKEIIIDSWNNPPGRALSKVDITDYVKGNGEYKIIWKYKGGKSGVCIIDVDISPSE